MPEQMQVGSRPQGKTSSLALLWNVSPQRQHKLSQPFLSVIPAQLYKAQSVPALDPRKPFPASSHLPWSSPAYSITAWTLRRRCRVGFIFTTCTWGAGWAAHLWQRGGIKGKGAQRLTLWSHRPHALHCTAELDNTFRACREPKLQAHLAHCRHLALVCVCTPDWSQPFAITWDKPCSLLQFPPINHKGSTPWLPACLVFLTWKSSLAAVYFSPLLVCLCCKLYITPKPGSFSWSQTEMCKKWYYYSPLDKTSFVV